MYSTTPPIMSLSEFEQSIISDTIFFQTKRVIVQKIIDSFANLAQNFKHEAGITLLQTECGTPKISKGENYKKLPYVVLDYPRIFKPNDILAIRSMFWWGNFFSITLHIAGSYKENYLPNIIQYFLKHGPNNWYVCVNNNAWEHHFDSDNYQLMDNGKLQDLKTKPFVKLSKKIPLNEWESFNDFYSSNFNILLEALNYQAPMR